MSLAGLCVCVVMFLCLGTLSSFQSMGLPPEHCWLAVCAVLCCAVCAVLCVLCCAVLCVLCVLCVCERTCVPACACLGVHLAPTHTQMHTGTEERERETSALHVKG